MVFCESEYKANGLLIWIGQSWFVQGVFYLFIVTFVFMDLDVCMAVLFIRRRRQRCDMATETTTTIFLFKRKWKIKTVMKFLLTKQRRRCVFVPHIYAIYLPPLHRKSITASSLITKLSSSTYRRRETAKRKGFFIVVRIFLKTLKVKGSIILCIILSVMHFLQFYFWW